MVPISDSHLGKQGPLSLLMETSPAARILWKQCRLTSKPLCWALMYLFVYHLSCTDSRVVYQMMLIHDGICCKWNSQHPYCGVLMKMDAALEYLCFLCKTYVWLLYTYQLHAILLQVKVWNLLNVSAITNSCSRWVVMLSVILSSWWSIKSDTYVAPILYSLSLMEM